MSVRRDRERERAMRDRDRERERVVRKEGDERNTETERRAEQLREPWRQRHPEKDDGKDRPKKGGPS